MPMFLDVNVPVKRAYPLHPHPSRAIGQILKILARTNASVAILRYDSYSYEFLADDLSASGGRIRMMRTLTALCRSYLLKTQTEFKATLDALRALPAEGMPALFLDMDGVANDLDLAYLRMYGTHLSLEPKDVLWANIDRWPNFYASAPPFERFLDFAGAIKHLGPKFLSSVRTDNHIENKVKWICTHGLDFEFIGVKPDANGRHDKTAFVTEGAVLVDDFDFNVEAWTSAGGFGIEHVTFDVTAAKLLAHLRSVMEVSA